MDGGSPTPAGERQRAPVVVCCAAADEAAVNEALEAIASDGHPTRVVLTEGGDPHVLEPALDEHEGALVVLVRGTDLTRDAIEDLREVLLSRKVPFSRTLTVGAGAPATLGARIKATLKRLSVSRPQRTPSGRQVATRAPSGRQVAARPPSGPQPATRAPRAAPLGGTTPPPPPRARRVPPKARTVGDDTTSGKLPAPIVNQPNQPAFEDDDAASQGVPQEAELVPSLEAVLAEDSIVAPRPVGVSVHPEDGYLEVEPEDSLSDIAESISNIDLSDLDYGDTSVGPMPDGGTQTGALISGDTVIQQAPLGPGNTVRTPPPAPAPSSPATSTPGMAPSPPGVAARPAGPVSRWWWLAAGLGVSGLLLLALLFGLSGDDGDDGDGGGKARSAARSGAKSSKDAAKGKGATPPAGEKSSSEAAADGPSPSGDEGGGEPTPPEPADVRPATPAAQVAIYGALRRRSVRALDTLLVTPTEIGPIAWRDAADYCGTLEIDGLVDWRLPEVGELTSLAAAAMLGRQTYWSATPADTFGDAHLGWYVRRRRVVTPSRDARAVCVRGPRVRP